MKLTVKDKKTGRTKNFYGVYSTEARGWIIGLYPSLKELRKIYPSLRRLKPISYKRLFGRSAEAVLIGNKIVLLLKVPIFEFGSSRRRKSR